MKKNSDGRTTLDAVHCFIGETRKKVFFLLVSGPAADIGIMKKNINGCGQAVHGNGALKAFVTPGGSRYPKTIDRQ